MTFLLIKIIEQMGNSPDFSGIRQNTIAKRDQNLKKYRGIFAQILEKSNTTPTKIQKIIDSNLSELVELLNSGKTTSTELIAVFGARAATIGRKMCIITEGNFEYALEKARECDDTRTKTGKKNCTLEEEFDEQKHLPWLFGIPISVKDNIDMEGTRSTIGLTIRADKIKTEDNCIIQCVKNSGMIPYMKTNLPQIALNYDSSNFLWGRTLNPWNQNKSAGGSSGGEGASIAARTSPIGIGNDMLGSVRIPAAFNGVCGLMVSVGRLPAMNACSYYSRGFSGMDTIKVITGPLGKAVGDLALWLSTMSTEEYYNGSQDPYVKLRPFNTKLYKEISQKKLVIGYIDSFDLIEPSASMKRGVQETIQILRKQGHTLIEVKVPNQTQLLLAPFYELMGEGDMTSFVGMLEGEQLSEQYSNFKKVSGMNWALSGFLIWLLNKIQPRVGMALHASGKLTLHQYLQKTGRLYELREEWINYWRKNKFDFIISPGFGCSATDHGFSNDCSLIAAYVYLWNVLAYPSCSIPVSVVREDELNYESKWDDDFTKAIQKTVSTSQGLPVNIQVIGLPFSEEGILGICKEIESQIKFYKKHPLPHLEA